MTKEPNLLDKKFSELHSALFLESDSKKSESVKKSCEDFLNFLNNTPGAFDLYTTNNSYRCGLDPLSAASGLYEEYDLYSAQTNKSKTEDKEQIKSLLEETKDAAKNIKEFAPHRKYDCRVMIRLSGKDEGKGSR
jgi:hypothetical protein